ncbi:MAG: hypothetical protein LBU11_05890 [Zoogloeaceae bacterium]|nr:hypothetical protein [Zoogloeaceae bacterium]
MTDMALRYRISPKLRQAAAMLIVKKSRAMNLYQHLFSITASLGFAALAVDMFSRRGSSFALELFGMVCFAACFLFSFLLQIFMHRKNSEGAAGEVSLTVGEDGISCSQAEGQAQSLFLWSYILEIREIRAKKRGDDWLAILLNNRSLGLLTVVPFSAFADDAARQAFVDMVNAGIGKAKQTRIEGAPND